MYAANNQTVSNVYLTNIYLSVDASLTDASVTQNKKITTDICSKKLHVIIAIIFTNVASTFLMFWRSYIIFIQSAAIDRSWNA